MHTSDRAEITVLIGHIERLLEPRILIYHSEVPDTAGRKTRRTRRRKETGNCKELWFQAKTIIDRF